MHSTLSICHAAWDRNQVGETWADMSLYFFANSSTPCASSSSGTTAIHMPNVEWCRLMLYGQEPMNHKSVSICSGIFHCGCQWRSYVQAGKPTGLLALTLRPAPKSCLMMRRAICPRAPAIGCSPERSAIRLVEQ